MRVPGARFLFIRIVICAAACLHAQSFPSSIASDDIPPFLPGSSSVPASNETAPALSGQPGEPADIADYSTVAGGEPELDDSCTVDCGVTPENASPGAASDGIDPASPPAELAPIIVAASTPAVQADLFLQVRCRDFETNTLSVLFRDVHAKLHFQLYDLGSRRWSSDAVRVPENLEDMISGHLFVGDRMIVTRNQQTQIFLCTFPGLQILKERTLPNPTGVTAIYADTAGNRVVALVGGYGKGVFYRITPDLEIEASKEVGLGSFASGAADDGFFYFHSHGDCSMYRTRHDFGAFERIAPMKRSDYNGACAGRGRVFMESYGHVYSYDREFSTEADLGEAYCPSCVPQIGLTRDFIVTIAPDLKALKVFDWDHQPVATVPLP